MADDGLLRARTAEFIRFAIVGAFSTILFAVIVYVLLNLTDIRPTYANALGYLIAIPLNYVFQRGYSFRSSQAKRTEFPRFIAVHAINLLASAGLMWFVHDRLRLHEYWGIAVTAFCIPLLTYFVMRRFVFDPGSATR